MPINDNEMRYDYELHRYVLRSPALLAQGVNIELALNTNGNMAKVNAFFERVSDSVYDFIYQDNPNDQLIEYLLAKNEKARPIIKKMLISQALYALDNNFIDDFSGANISKGAQMDIKGLRSVAKVAPQVFDWCYRLIDDMPCVLKASYVVGRLPKDLLHKDY